ncbi:MAG: hypothetical protein ACXU8U_02855 [Asticcacaulis sp.]
MLTLRAGHGHGHWSDAVSVAIAMTLLGFGCLLLATSYFDGRAGAPKLRRQSRMQALTLVLAGVMLAVPPLAGVHEGMGGWAVFIAIATLFAAQSAINLALWRTADEFYRRAMKDASATSFWLLQGALFLWAVAERLGLAPTLSAWDLISILMAVYLGLSAVVARRLGAG